MEKIFGAVTGVVVILGLAGVAATASADTTIKPVYRSENVKNLTHVNAGLSANDSVYFPHVSTATTK
ncbi:hypothetical protein [Levilactobacillus zymae]|uniref:Uncharacterized protein n=1 Tax=Levilactobacillus zymae TaxID=267363 RepID=A0A1Y6K0X5_9LACO|nr:hypothetical protein [Levilactobacillus zymae]KRL09580.1 hypothetical protein FD38_GL002177 [Levilactobacillus zymae DSM 19395]QFR62284.1 hypothetical protein LZ395_12360 [Levilactobacillus zymae]SMS15051.1 hypothetical protein LZ3411_2001 [Levilactobacillus zymae]SMS15120.1 hypothetical protein LZ3411_2070 [Levilactobacillus zymae]GEO71950.1 hypothetical protein LZY01_11180 [Levilactobacillus zymae]